VLSGADKTVSIAEVHDRGPQWRQCAPENCIWKNFGVDYVLYHRPSGTTHLINDASYRLLTELLNEPRDFPSIAKFFESTEVQFDSAEYVSRMAAMLDRLEHLGLIERAFH
jgi:PqqD family protein of HPr-rel-A system